MSTLKLKEICPLSWGAGPLGHVTRTQLDPEVKHEHVVGSKGRTSGPRYGTGAEAESIEDGRGVVIKKTYEPGAL